MLKRPEEPEINNEDPWADDLLGRQEIARFLESYLEDSQGFVLNVDSDWGSGKTFFMRRWATDVASRHPALYFNAWQSDTSEDPFIAFVAELSEQLQTTAGAEPIKQLASKAGRVMTSLGPVLLKAAIRKTVGEAGLEELQGALPDAVVEKLGSVAEVAMQEHAARKESIVGFRDQLQDVVEKSGNGPLFVFVDELDRCRPTFAISLLEAIKHLFSVPNVVFIVATDTAQLASSVCAVYGEGFDGAGYLRRFFDQTYKLPAPNIDEFCRTLVQSCPLPEDRGLTYQHAQKRDNVDFDVAEELALICSFLGLPLRDVEQVYHRVVAATYALESEMVFFSHLVVLAIARIKEEQSYLEFMKDRSHGGQLFSRLTGNEASAHPVLGAVAPLVADMHDRERLRARREARRNRARSVEEAHLLFSRNRFVALGVEHFASLEKHPDAIELAANLK